ncbi:TPA: hypothetical protein SK282_000086 [Yersinia enterocolitica]|nr:hypothetical protein [Yersinia enterocolitica]
MVFFKRWYVVLSVVFGVIITLATIDNKQIKENWQLAEDWYYSNPKLTGSWSSSYHGEGGLSANNWIESPEQTVIDVDIIGREVSGVISTPKIREFIKKTPQLVDYFMVEGEKDRFSNVFSANVFEYIYGHKYLFAVLRFELRDGKLIMEDVSDGGSEFVPKRVVLIKRADTTYDSRFDDHIHAYAMDKANHFSEPKAVQVDE